MGQSRLATLNPVDILDLFNSDVPLRNLIGKQTKNGSEVRALTLNSERLHSSITGVTGLEVVVERIQGARKQTLLDGRIKRESELTLYAANWAGSLESLDILLTQRFGLGNVTKTALANGQAYATAVGAQSETYFDGVVEAASYKLITGAPAYLNQAEDVLEAPQDGNTYARQNGSWVAAAGGDAVDLTAYATTASVEARVERADGGYEFTGGFADRLTGAAGQNDLGSLVSYDQTMVTEQRWLRFGFSSAANQANDNQYWGEADPAYDNTKGLFGGLHMPAGVTKLFSFDDATDYNLASDSGTKYTAAGGSIDFSECRVGDLALVRFDFNVKPQVANTTLEVAMIWQTRDANDVGTFTFALTGEPVFYGTGTVGRTFLNRPLLSAYFASAEDVNARALLAVRADNPIQVAPLTTLVTLVR